MRTFVIGDPQAPFAKVLEVLDRHGVLAGDRIAPDVVLVSIGDHFDYDLRDPVTAGQEGLRLLRWLASHDPAQVKILFGNHDAARVMELASMTDATFDEARTLARAIEAGTRTEAEFRAAYPELPPSGVIGRDYASFSVEQRSLVIELLLAGRFRLALVGELVDRRGDALITHAAVTTRELAMLGIVGAEESRTIAAALDTLLDVAVDRVRADWQRNVTTPLSLAPLHATGGNGLEGGGLLYHRPSNPAVGVNPPASISGPAVGVNPPASISGPAVGVNPPASISGPAVGVKPPASISGPAVGVNPPPTISGPAVGVNPPASISARRSE